MLQKLNTHHKRSKLFLSPVNSSSALFGIRHFAGTVYYTAKGKIVIIVTSNLHDIFKSLSGFTGNKTFGKEKSTNFICALLPILLTFVWDKIT